MKSSTPCITNSQLTPSYPPRSINRDLSIPQPRGLHQTEGSPGTRHQRKKKQKQIHLAEQIFKFPQKTNFKPSNMAGV